jgi:hypothetical protein
MWGLIFFRVHSAQKNTFFALMIDALLKKAQEKSLSCE